MCPVTAVRWNLTRWNRGSPYSASKASGDLMTLAYHVTYELPVTITRGANNIGPYQYPEKVLPLLPRMP